MHGCRFQTGEAVTSHIIAYDNICMVVGFRQGAVTSHIIAYDNICMVVGFIQGELLRHRL